MPISILLVDDEPKGSYGTQLLLEDAGYQVERVQSVAEAISKLDEHPFDLCITDLSMPGESGIDLLRFIRKEPRYRELPVIVQSGFADIGFKDVIKYHPISVLRKCAHIEDLLSAVREATRRIHKNYVESSFDKISHAKA